MHTTTDFRAALTEAVRDAQPASDDRDALIEVAQLRATVPWWPYSTHGTYRLMRSGKLGHVAIGGRRYLTRRLLADCIARHTVEVTP